MRKLLEFLRPLLIQNYRHPFLAAGTGIVIAVVAGFYAVRLKIDTDIAHLLPKANQHVLALEELQETIGGETEMQVAIQSPDFEDNTRFAEDLIKQSLKLYNERTGNYFFKRAEFKKDTKILKDNALYFATGQELTDIKQYLQDEIRSAKEEANPFLIDFEEEEEDTAAKNEELKRFEESYNSLIPSEYPVSPDSTVMVVKFFPTGSKSDLTYLRNMFASYDSLLAGMDPQSYHPEMKVLYGGRLKRHLSELESIMNDVYSSFASGISSVILLVMFYFFFKKYRSYRRGKTDQQSHSFWEHLVRLPVPVLVIGIPLLISLLWTFGITYFVLGMLNTMTSVLFVILFGMGIDYGIHFYARYIENRSGGMNIPDALLITYDRTGSAILISSFTTAFSLFILVVAKFRGFSEFGFIAGMGILLALFCMLFILPSLLVIFERFGWILLNEDKPENQGSKLFHRFPLARSIVVVGLLVSAVVILNHRHLRFQYDFGKLEPEFLEYQAFRDVQRKVISGEKRNPAYILADNEREVIKILNKLREKMRADTTSPTILDVEALQERFPPTDSAAHEKLEHIAEIRTLLNDPFINTQDNPQLDRLRRAAQTKDPLKVSEIPDYLKNQFVTKDGEIGNFVIVYPSVGLSDGRQSIAFKNDVGKIELDNGKIFYAASTSIIAAEMLELMRNETPWMVGATFTMVFLLMLFSFGSFRWTIIGMLPLAVGLLWLFGIMMITGMMFNFYNLVVLPAILGIGEDNGVHLAHRYRQEGRNSMWEVLSSTGQHITVGSFTTMLGFSGLLFTYHPGLQSLGAMAVIGIGMTWIAALVFLPALTQWLEDKDWIRF